KILAKGFVIGVGQTELLEIEIAAKPARGFPAQRGCISPRRQNAAIGRIASELKHGAEDRACALQIENFLRANRLVIDVANVNQLGAQREQCRIGVIETLADGYAVADP